MGLRFLSTVIFIYFLNLNMYVRLYPVSVSFIHMGFYLRCIFVKGVQASNSLKSRVEIESNSLKVTLGVTWSPSYIYIYIYSPFVYFAALFFLKELWEAIWSFITQFYKCFGNQGCLSLLSIIFFIYFLNLNMYVWMYLVCLPFIHMGFLSALPLIIISFYIFYSFLEKLALMILLNPTFSVDLATLFLITSQRAGEKT